MRAPLHVYRLFDPRAERPALAEGLDLGGLEAFRPEWRSRMPFHGTAAASINAGEAFFDDAVDFLRRRTLPLANPFGGSPLATDDIVACPATPWATVPLYVARFAAAEPVALVKRGLSWCTDVGLVFPRRRLLVSLQAEERRMAQDIADVTHLEQWFAGQGVEAFETASPGASRPPCLLVTSEHVAHHLWNELSVIDGIIAAGVHHDLHLLVNRAPIAAIPALFPELHAAQVETLSGPPDAPMRGARERGWSVVPAGRRHLASSMIERVLRVARASHADAAATAAAFRARHDVVLWLTLRLDARTATNLVEALGRLVTAVRSRYPRLGVIVDGFTLPAGADAGWNEAVIDRERRTLPALLDAFGNQPAVVVAGQATTEACVWAAVADYYVTPYGTAQHKVAWINPVPGLVHAGENKRAVAFTDAGLYARQAGAEPAFFFSPVTRRDVAPDARQDLQSYTLDIDAFVAHALDDMGTRLAPPSVLS